MIGTSLSRYRIVDKLGAGGMGEAYRAEDTNLNRQVAIKVLPDIFAGDLERLARFEREAKPLASLNHPNIASIYGLEEADGKHFLVLELVEGQTLHTGRSSEVFGPEGGSRRIISTQKPGEIGTGLQARTLKRKPRLSFLSTVSSPRTDIPTTVRMRSVFQ